MSRGGRRRRSKRTPQPTPGAGDSSTGGEPVEAHEAQSGIVRARREPGGRQGAVEAMRTLPATVSTLPPDGLILEDLIATMQTEYGTPSTPQEYRLLLKVSTSEETVAAPSPEPADDAGADEESPPRRPRGARRRRRGARRPGATADAESEEGEPDEEPPEPETA